MKKCRHQFCRKNIQGRIPFIIKKKVMFDYEDFNFCSLECMLRYMQKKHKIKLNKMGY